MIKKISALAVFLLSVFSFSAVALASNGEGFTIVSANPNTINPRRFIFELKPGESVNDFVEIQNLADTEKTFMLYGADPTFSAQGTPAYKTRQAGGNGEGHWITFDEPEVTLAAGEKRIVRFTLTVPPTAAMGDYRAGIAMEKAPQQSPTQPGISIATRIILHAEIKVTDNPSSIPKQDGTLVTGSTVSTPAAAPAKYDWRTFYFWISLALFVLSALALLWVTMSECYYRKKQSAAERKTEREALRAEAAVKHTAKKAALRKTTLRKTKPHQTAPAKKSSARKSKKRPDSV